MNKFDIGMKKQLWKALAVESKDKKVEEERPKHGLLSPYKEEEKIDEILRNIPIENSNRKK